MKTSYNNYVKELYKNSELYANEFDAYKDDIYFWPKVVSKIKPKNLLEVGIGNGRLIEILHNKVEKYTGIDFSKEMVDYCKIKHNYKNVYLYCQNIKECKLKEKYDLIILPFNVINNFYTEKDLSKLFNHIKQLCSNETITVIDTVNPSIKDLLERSNFIQTNQFTLHENKIKVYENKKFNNLTSTCVYTKRYMLNNKIIKESILPNRIFFHQELLLILKTYGFEIVNQFGDYNFETLTSRSRKQILFIRRKQSEK